MTDAQIVINILSCHKFYDLVYSDGCFCANICLRGIDLDVHCWKSSGHQFTNYFGDQFSCDCRWASIHITPQNLSDVSELQAIGELIRKEMNRPDMNIKIILHQPVAEPDHGRPKVITINAPRPKDGFDYDD